MKDNYCIAEKIDDQWILYMDGCGDIKTYTLNRALKHYAILVQKGNIELMQIRSVEIEVNSVLENPTNEEKQYFCDHCMFDPTLRKD